MRKHSLQIVVNSLKSIAARPIYFIAAIGLALVFLFGLPSCTKKDEGTISFNYDYYPYSLGHYVTYSVDSIFYTYSNPNYFRDTARYELKELIADTLYDNENALNYKIELYRRADSTDSWAIWKVWYLKPTTTNIQKVEDDIRFIKLIFPPKEGAEWNGNLYVPTTDPYTVYRDWNYVYSDVDKPYSINGFNFDSSLTVTAVDVSNNLITKTLHREVYAKNVGMIYQEWEDMHKGVSGTFEQNTTNGFRIRMRIIDHN
ncbi:MAG: hypothetical protein U0V74_04005 [Chitinophagales bacterium]